MHRVKSKPFDELKTQNANMLRDMAIGANLIFLSRLTLKGERAPTNVTGWNRLILDSVAPLVYSKAAVNGTMLYMTVESPFGHVKKMFTTPQISGESGIRTVSG